MKARARDLVDPSQFKNNGGGKKKLAFDSAASPKPPHLSETDIFCFRLSDLLTSGLAM
jgi:hypothetical protein